MRIGRRLVKALKWGFVLCLSILGGGPRVRILVRDRRRDELRN